MPIPVSWSWVQIPRSVFIFFDFSPPILSNGVMRDKNVELFTILCCILAQGPYYSSLYRSILVYVLLKQVKLYSQNLAYYFWWCGQIWIKIWTPIPHGERTQDLCFGSQSHYPLHCWYSSPWEVNWNPFQCLSRRLGPGFESPDRIFIFSIFPLLSYQMG